MPLTSRAMGWLRTTAITAAVALALPTALPAAATTPGHLAAPATASTVQPASTPVPHVGTPFVWGSGTVGGSLEVVSAGWTATPDTTTFAWLRDGQPIAGATGRTYSPVTADLGALLTVQETATLAGSTTTLTSNAVRVGEEGLQAYRLSGFDGVADVGGTLTPKTATWYDPQPTSVTYVWMRNDQPLPGRVGGSYTVTEADRGTTISVKLVASHGTYGATSVKNGAATIYFGDLTEDAPPTLAGTPRVGSTLTLRLGTSTPEATSVDPVWVVGGKVVQPDTPDDLTLTLRPEHEGKTVTVNQRVYRQWWRGTTLRSQVLTVGPADLTLVAQPTIVGVPLLGSTLTVAGAAWSPAADRTSVQWLRDGVAIRGATSNRYVPVAADVGATLTARVTPHLGDYPPLPAEAEVGPIAPGDLGAPVASVTGLVAAGSTVTVSTGAWRAPSPTLSYAWLVDGKVVAGATTGTLRLTAAQVGRQLTARVTATAPGYRTASVTTRSVAVQPELTPVTAPSVRGTAKVGRTLTGRPGTWSVPSARLSYQWLRGSKAIAGATARTYTVTKADIGTRLSLRVTATTTASGTRSATARATTKVAKVAPKITVALASSTSTTTRATVKVRVSAPVVTKAARGKVTISWGTKASQRRTLTLTAKRKGRVSYRLPVLRTKGTYRITVRFTPTSTHGRYLAKATTKRVLKVR